MSRSLEEMKIREALRLKETGLSNAQIVNSGTVQCARSTLIELFKRCTHAGIDYERAKDLSDHELEAILYPRKHAATRPAVAINEEQWLLRIKTSGLDRQSVWEEYIQQNPDGVSYAHFCRRLRDYEALTSPNLDYPKQRKPGEIMETDWCGNKLEIVYKQQHLVQAHFFVAVMGFSQKLFAYACPDEKQGSWINAHTKALEYFGAVPRIIKPDNTKTAISQSHRYEPKRNPIFSEWAAYYGVAIVPARVGKPKDKDRVENGAGIFTQKIMPKLRNQLFFDFNALNEFIGHEVEKINKKAYQRRPGNRSAIFQEVDFPAMRPLPAHPFSVREILWVKVSRNGYHVHFDGHQYSAPFHFAGHKLLLSATSTTVELFYDNKRVACHQRCYSIHRHYVTDIEHMPPKHRAQYLVDAMDGNKYRFWAKSVGPSTLHVISKLLEQYAIEEQVYQTCMGILRLADKYSPYYLEKACTTACQAGAFSYHAIKYYVEEEAKTRNELVKIHENIRGASYYGGEPT